MIEELPLSELAGLLKYAEEKELEQTLYPAWCAHFTAAQVLGVEPTAYEELISKVKESATDNRTCKRSASEIYAEFAPMIANQRNREEGCCG